MYLSVSVCWRYLCEILKAKFLGCSLVRMHTGYEGGHHDRGYPALMGAPDNITVTVTTAKHYYELFSA